MSRGLHLRAELLFSHRLGYDLVVYVEVVMKGRRSRYACYNAVQVVPRLKMRQFARIIKRALPTPSAS